MAETPHTVTIPGYMIRSMVMVMRRLMVIGRRQDTIPDYNKGKVLIETLERLVERQTMPNVPVVARAHVSGFPRHHWTQEKREEQVRKAIEEKIMPEVLALDSRDGGQGSFDVILYYREL